jgi:hypothetical protein
MTKKECNANGGVTASKAKQSGAAAGWIASPAARDDGLKAES